MTSEERMKEEESVIIAAIDFGTTFSGVCWVLSSATDVKHLIRDWPAIEEANSTISTDKIPTKLAYNEAGEIIAWGGQVKPLQPRYQEFKLLLDKIDSEAQAGLANKYPDRASLPITDLFTPTKLSIDFLRQIREWLEVRVEMVIGARTFNTMKVEYVITVPAIWSEKAKGTTKWCAKEAGMGNDVKLITEPEAAMVYALDQLPRSDVRNEDAYILCDAGGGTVDLVTYVVRDVDPLKVDEVVSGDGACCGSAYINRLFQEYVEKTFTHLRFWKEEYTTKALDYFEKIAKPKFDEEDVEVTIKIPGVPNYDEGDIRIKKEKLYLPAALIRKMFVEGLQIICGMIQEQKRRASKKRIWITALIFVGGFAQSPFAQKYLRSEIYWLRKDVKLIVPTDGWTAVVRGALNRALPILCPSTVVPMVGSRITRLSYGITYSVEFKENEDPIKARFLDAIDGKYYVEKIEWFLHKGAKVNERYQSRFSYVHSWQRNTPNANKKVIKLNIFSYNGPSDKPTPRYPGAEGVVKVTELNVDFSKIPTDQLKTYHKQPGNIPYNWCNPHVRISYSFASIQYQMWYKEVCYGNVETGFES